MRAPRRLIAFAAVAALVGAACGSDSDSDSSASDTTGTETTETTEAPDSTEATTETTEAATTETTEYQAPARGDADLVIWADDTRAPVLEPIASEFGDTEGITVQVVEVPFDQIRDQLSIAGPAGEGPDIVTGAHDWLGELVSNGVVAPIDLGPDAELYAPVAIEAFTYDGALVRRPVRHREHRPDPQRRPRPRGAGHVRGPRGHGTRTPGRRHRRRAARCPAGPC